MTSTIIIFKKNTGITSEVKGEYLISNTSFFQIYMIKYSIVIPLFCIIYIEPLLSIGRDNNSLYPVLTCCRTK